MSTESHNLEVRAEREPNVTLVYLSGEIDLRTSPQLRATLLEIVDEKPARVVLDLSGVSYMDSSGIGTMVELKRRAAQRDSKVVLVGLQERVRSVFEITRLDKFFDIVDSIDEARET